MMPVIPLLHHDNEEKPSQRRAFSVFAACAGRQAEPCGVSSGLPGAPDQEQRSSNGIAVPAARKTNENPENTQGSIPGLSFRSHLPWEDRPRSSPGHFNETRGIQLQIIITSILSGLDPPGVRIARSTGHPGGEEADVLQPYEQRCVSLVDEQLHQGGLLRRAYLRTGGSTGRHCPD